MIPLNNKIKRNAFVPVKLPKVRDVFKRRGYLPSRESPALMGGSRNPLEIHDNVQRGFDQFVYDQYCKEREQELEQERETQQQREQSQDESGKKSDKDDPAPDDKQ